MQIVVPLTSSAYHLELNLKSLAKNARHALMAIVKEITENHVDTSEFSDASFKTDFKGQQIVTQFFFKIFQTPMIYIIFIL